MEHEMEPAGGQDHGTTKSFGSFDEVDSEVSSRLQASTSFTSSGGGGAYGGAYGSSPPARGSSRSGFYSNILANVNKKLWADQSTVPTPEEALRHAEAALLPLRESKGQPSPTDEPEEPVELVEVRMGADSTPPKALPVLTDSAGRRYVSITIHRCSRGLGLLPARSNNEKTICLAGSPGLRESGCSEDFVWVRSPEFTSLAEYLRQFLFFFDSPKWAGLIFDRMDDMTLPRYQCVVVDDHWRDCWTVLAQKFPLMCMAYRRNLGGKAAPHLKFGAGLRCASEKTDE